MDDKLAPHHKAENEKMAFDYRVIARANAQIGKNCETLKRK